MKNLVLGIVSITLIVTSGIVHGFWTERWSVSEEVQRGAASVDQVPLEIGDWKGEHIPRTVESQPGIAKNSFRRYRNVRTGDVVDIALVCGRAGPVCIHTPDVCYVASGYQVGNKTDVNVKFSGGEGQFYTADAVKSNATRKTALRLFWAWNVEGTWKVDGSPRSTFGGGRNVLYKLYVVRDLSAPTELKMDPCADFLRQALPVLSKTLVTK